MAVVMILIASALDGVDGQVARLLRGTSRFAVDYFPLTETFLSRAQELDPANPAWASNLEELRKLRASAR